MADLGFKEDESAAKELGFIEDASAITPKSKYAQPRSMTASDEELGLRTGPVSSARLPGTALSVPLRPSMSELESEHLNEQAIGGVQRVENALGLAAAGGALGTVAKTGVLGATAPKAATGVNALSKFAKKVPLADRIAEVLTKTDHKLLGMIVPPAAKAVGGAAKAGANAAAATLPVAGAAAGAVVGMDEAAPDEPAPFKGVMHNAIERLRLSAAAGNANAMDLLSRVDKDHGETFGTVTQGTGVTP